MNVYDHAHALARALRQHPDVLAMQAAKGRVDADPQAKDMLDNFMQKSMQLQLQEMRGDPPSDEAKEELAKLADIVYLHADIRQFQEASMRVERVLQDIYRIIAAAIQPEQEQ